MLTELYLKNNQSAKALACQETLININPNNSANYMKVLQCEGIQDPRDPDSIDKIVEVLSRYLDKKATKSKAQRVLLDLMPATHAIFRKTLVDYLRPQIIKGVMSVINEIKVYYREDSKKADIIGEILHGMNTSMETNMCLDPEDEDEQDPTVQLWLYYYLS